MTCELCGDACPMDEGPTDAELEWRRERAAQRERIWHTLKNPPTDEELLEMFR